MEKEEKIVEMVDLNTIPLGKLTGFAALALVRAATKVTVDATKWTSKTAKKAIDVQKAKANRIESLERELAELKAKLSTTPTEEKNNG